MYDVIIRLGYISNTQLITMNLGLRGCSWLQVAMLQGHLLFS